MQRSVAKLLIVFAALAGFVIAVYVSFVNVAERSRTAKQAQVRRPAAMDAYEALLDQIRGEQVAESARESGHEDVTGFDGFPRNAIGAINRYDDLFTSLKERLRPLGVGPGIRNDLPEGWFVAGMPELAEFVLANQDLIDEIRLMADRGGPVYPLDLSKGYFGLELPHLSPLSWCARLLGVDAIMKAGKGKHSEAIEDIVAGMKLADALTLEPVRASQAMHTEIYRGMIYALRDSFDGGDLSVELTDKLLSHIAQADHRHAFAESLAGALHLELRTFSDLRAGDLERLAWFERVSSTNPVEWMCVRFYSSPLRRPWVDMDEATYIDIMTQLISVAELPYYGAAPELGRIEKGVRSLPRTRVLSRLLFTTTSFHTQAQHEAMLDLVQMGLLVEQYKASTGTYPERLDAVAPELGESPPVDPFTGNAYHYQPSDDGFLLYSVGQNLIDDGGRHDFWSGDIVWRGDTD